VVEIAEIKSAIALGRDKKKGRKYFNSLDVTLSVTAGGSHSLTRIFLENRLDKDVNCHARRNRC